MLGHAGVWALVLARVLGLCLTAPALAVPGAGLAVPAGAGRASSVRFWFRVLEPMIVPPVGWPGIAQAVLLEVLTGGVLGWSAALIVAGARLAGELVAAQAGLSTATLFDPETGEEVTPWAGFTAGSRWPCFWRSMARWSWSGRWSRAIDAVPAGRLLISHETASAGLRAGGPCPGAGAPSGRARRRWP